MERSFRFAMPLEIMEKDENGWKIQGVASTEHEDLQGEIVKQNGLDFSHIKKGLGLFNWNHKNDPKYILGKISDAKMDGKKTIVSGYLFDKVDNAKAIVQIMQSLKPEDKHRVQMSIEGKIMERGGPSNKEIRRAKVERVALTMDAVNPHTYVDLAKSLMSEDEIKDPEPLAEDKIVAISGDETVIEKSTSPLEESKVEDAGQVTLPIEKLQALLNKAMSGSQKSGHKYIERKGSPGNYQYKYRNEKTGETYWGDESGKPLGGEKKEGQPEGSGGKGLEGISPEVKKKLISAAQTMMNNKELSEGERAAAKKIFEGFSAMKEHTPVTRELEAKVAKLEAKLEEKDKKKLNEGADFSLDEQKRRKQEKHKELNEKFKEHQKKDPTREKEEKEYKEKEAKRKEAQIKHTQKLVDKKKAEGKDTTGAEAANKNAKKSKRVDRIIEGFGDNLEDLYEFAGISESQIDNAYENAGRVEAQEKLEEMARKKIMSMSDDKLSDSEELLGIEEETKKTLTVGYSGADAPTSRTGGAALAPESLDGDIKDVKKKKKVKKTDVTNLNFSAEDPDKDKPNKLIKKSLREKYTTIFKALHHIYKKKYKGLSPEELARAVHEHVLDKIGLSK